MAEAPHPLRIFLCHSSGDKQTVRELYKRLRASGFSPWLDEEDLLPGQRWEDEIPRAVRNSDVVIVCLSRASINKRGYVQKEIKYALDVASEQPEGTIFLIPLRLEECEVPASLRSNHWVDYFQPNGYERLVTALKSRARELGISASVISADYGTSDYEKLQTSEPSSPYRKGGSYKRGDTGGSSSNKQVVRRLTLSAVISVLLMLPVYIAIQWTRVKPVLVTTAHTLYPGSGNRADGVVAKVILTGGEQIVRLHLAIIEDKYQSYRGELFGVNGESLAIEDDLHVASQDGVNVVIMPLPAQVLSPGTYTVSLSGRTTEGGMQKVASYYFRIMSK